MSPNTAIEIKDLKNPPAVEAIIEIRFPAFEGEDASSIFDQIQKEFELNYPLSQKRTTINKTINFDLQNQKTIDTTEETVIQAGLQLLSSSKDSSQKSIIFDVDKLIVSNIGKYCGGDDLISIFDDALCCYIKYFKPSEFNRLAMRYINKIDYKTVEELGMKMRVLPLLPDVGGEDFFIKDLLCSFAVADQQLLNKVNLNYFFNPNSDNQPNGSGVTVIADIDAFQEVNSMAVAVDVIKNKLNIIREFKNKFFIGSFTSVGMEDFK